MIIIDQCNTVTIIYSRAILIAVRSDCCVKGVICKTRTGCSVGILANTAAQDQTPQNAASDQGLHCLLKLQGVSGSMQQSLLSVREHFSSLHSETTVLSVILICIIVAIISWPLRVYKKKKDIVVHMNKITCLLSTYTTLSANSANEKLMIYFFPWKQA